MELRGFDTYEVTLGDEIRGERASLGKSIQAVEQDLHIRRDILLAIENCDISGVMNPGLLPGYVRSYARYLGMDAEEFYARFCAESGFSPPRAGVAAGGGEGGSSIGKRLPGSPFDQSRFAVPPAQTRFSARVSLGALVSMAGLAVLIAGLGYGGWAVLQNIQRVGIAPLPEAPDVIAVAPEIGLPETRGDGPGAGAYDGGGALAGVYAPEGGDRTGTRDGPISAIDPERYGVYAGAAPPMQPRGEARGSTPAPSSPPAIDSADDAIRAARERRAELAADAARMSARLAALTGAGGGGEADAESAAAPEGIAVQVTGRAWIRVRNADRAVIREGILEAGERYALPRRALRATLRAGNAGAVFVVVDGIAYGPLGRPGGVVKNVSLAPDDIRREQARAEPGAVQLAGGDTPRPRAAAE